VKHPIIWLSAIAFVVSAVACGAAEYGKNLDNCVLQAHSRAEADACMHQVECDAGRGNCGDASK
jgi:hypothetical protein